MGGERNDICNTCTTSLVTIMNELSIKNVTLQVLRKHLINNDYLVSVFAFISVFTKYRFEHRPDASRLYFDVFFWFLFLSAYLIVGLLGVIFHIFLNIEEASKNLFRNRLHLKII